MASGFWVDFDVFIIGYLYPYSWIFDVLFEILFCVCQQLILEGTELGRVRANKKRLECIDRIASRPQSEVEDRKRCRLTQAARIDQLAQTFVVRFYRVHVPDCAQPTRQRQTWLARWPVSHTREAVPAASVSRHNRSATPLTVTLASAATSAECWPCLTVLNHIGFNMPGPVTGEICICWFSFKLSSHSGGSRQASKLHPRPRSQDSTFLHLPYVAVGIHHHLHGHIGRCFDLFQRDPKVAAKGRARK